MDTDVNNVTVHSFRVCSSAANRVEQSTNPLNQRTEVQQQQQLSLAQSTQALNQRNRAMVAAPHFLL